MANKEASPKRVFAPVGDAEAKIHKTMEYDKFKRMAGNRPIRRGHIQNIKIKIEEKDLKSPIVVNKQYEIIDGQHTLEARKELNLPVYYRFGEKMDLHDVQTLNSTNLPWNNDDFCDSYIELGNRHYKIYKSFRKKYQLQHETAMILLTGRDMKALRSVFRNGEFRVANLDDAEKKAQMLFSLRDYVPGARQDVFAKALMIANSRDGFNFKRFYEKAKENKSMFAYWPTIDQNLLMIETIYNTGPGKKIPLRYALTRKYERKQEQEQEQEPEAEGKKANGIAGRPDQRMGTRVRSISA